MGLKKIYRFSVLLAGLDIIFVIGLFFLIDGKFQNTSLRVSLPPAQETETVSRALPARIRSAAPEKPNVRVTDLTISSKSQGLFETERILEIECKIEIEQPTKIFQTAHSVVIKTDREEILRKTIEGDELEKSALIIRGNFVPKEKTGLRQVPVACRADYENAIEESDERDNRMVKYAMVF